MAELTGQTFAGFEIVAKLGQGGMGAVYKARQPLLDRFVALKVMSPQLSGDPGYIARFIREAASAAKLNHPNMVQVYTAGEQDGIYYIVMEFVEGESLNQRLKRVGALDPAEAIAITLHVATALQCAWNEARLIHRDIKPDNIFLSRKGEVKVGDLGLAKSVSGGATEMTQSGVMMGSPHYISPEQARASKETDFRADIYSLGCTLYQLLSGRTPYQADEALAVVLKHVTDPVPDILSVMPNCPQVLAALAGKMMTKDPNQRHSSYEELIAELWQASDIIRQQQSAVTAVMTPMPPPAAATVKPTAVKAAREPKSAIGNRRWVIAGGVAAVVLLLGLFLWSPWKSSQNSNTPSLQHSAALQLLGNVFTNAVGAEMVYIPAGEFMMGSTKEEQAWAVANGAKEEFVKPEGETARKTTIKKGFWMGRTQVTVKQWKDFIAATGYRTVAEKKGYADYVPQKGNQVVGASWKDPKFTVSQQDNHPVCCVARIDAEAFCKWLTDREREAGRLPSGSVVRLPTEAEWEYSCRAGTQTRFWWGDSPDEIKDRVNWIGPADGFEFTSPVDFYGPRGRNKFGLADMLSNVHEWCLDSYDPAGAHQECYQDPRDWGVVRGSSFMQNPAIGRCAFRMKETITSSIAKHGFRVCLAPEVSHPTATTIPPSSPAPSKEGGILAPPETRVTAPTMNPKVGEVYTLPIAGSVTMELMGIPAGEFMMGSTEEEQAWALANKCKEEYVKCEGNAPRKAMVKQGFWMGRTEVTVGQWKQFVKETAYVTDAEKKGESFVQPTSGGPYGPMKGKSWRDPNFGFELKDNHPVSCISWNDAKSFCEWMQRREQQAGRVAHGYTVRLPTEAEWEYACRAGRATRFWWGDSVEDGRDRLNWMGTTDGFRQVAPVDSYGDRGRNGFGLADMQGNISEWCMDEFDATQAHDDLWTGDHVARVLRGGAFVSNPASCRSAFRFGSPPPSPVSNCGFRVCYGVDVSGAESSTSPNSSAAAPKESVILAPPETRVVALTTNPKVGEVYTLTLDSNVTIELMGIPPGEFMLGSTKEEQAWAVRNHLREDVAKREGDAPRKSRINEGFWLGRTHVTVGQWKQFIAVTGYKTDAEKNGYADFALRKGQWSNRVQGVSWCDPGFGAPPPDNYPVCCVTWNDAVAFCEWLTERERQAGRLPAGQVIRLPAEAEWEYACRAGTQARFWWGDSVEDGKGRLNWAGKDDGFEFVSPVDHYGARGRNKFGLADMSGNVWQWCLDVFDPAGAHEEYNAGVSSPDRVARGSSFLSGPNFIRCACRERQSPSSANCLNGFRVCLGPDMLGARTGQATALPTAASKESGILAPPETRVAALTTNPKVGEVYALPLGGNVTMELMGIPPGECMLGSTKEEQGWAIADGCKEEYVRWEGGAPRKAGINQGFWLGRTGVAVGQWKLFVKETSYVTDAEKRGEACVPERPRMVSVWVKGKSWRDPNFGFEPQDSHPVCCVSWNDAKAFCEWLDGRERRAGRLALGYRVRLPTEAEWEYACRAGTQTKWWWGDLREDGRGRLNCGGRGKDGGKDDVFDFVAPVDYFGARGRNRFGLADMLGSLWEWCLDEFDATQAHEDLWTGNPDMRASRGGCFFSGLNQCRSAARSRSRLTQPDGSYGFRVCYGASR